MRDWKGKELEDKAVATTLLGNFAYE